MDDTNVLKTNVAEIVLENGILYITTAELNPTLADYEQHLKAIKAKFGALLPLPAVLKNPERAQVLTKDVRDFVVGKEMAEAIQSIAIMQSSMAIRLIANLFFKISKPSYPMQMFSDEAKAVEWLRSFGK